MADPRAIDHELTLARQAQAAANPGRARVCARRAAGWAVRAWYEAAKGGTWQGDALKQLRRLAADAAVPEPVRAAAVRLVTKVDLDHTLPFHDDPVVDARLIIAFAAEPQA
jgi:hypothetical protein